MVAICEVGQPHGQPVVVLGAAALGRCEEGVDPRELPLYRIQLLEGLEGFPHHAPVVSPGDMLREEPNSQVVGAVYPSFARRHIAGYHVEERALARAIPTHKPYPILLIHHQLHIAE